MIKWLFDRLLSALLLLLLFPALVAIGAAISLRQGRPVLLRQERAGRYGRPFTLFKFRTMTNARGADGALLPDEARITPLGALLRKSSLDELPELWNIFRGDMSFVGPRPLFMDYLPLYSKEQMRRHDVRPGLTGLAQINGRNATSWEKRLRLDVAYVDENSFMGDMEILVRTFHTALTADGVAHDGHVTMPRFTGSSGSDAAES